MNFSFTREEKKLQAEVQEFISCYFTDDVKSEFDDEKTGTSLIPKAKAFLKKISERGWFAVSWPKEYGGQGRSRVEQYIVEEEFWRGAAIMIGSGGTGAPAILASGTEEQKRYYIPKVINHEISFCQGYSEPHAGADLAGLRCRAQRVGDNYVINGQKIFTTGAHASTHIFLLARTDPQSSRQAGLSVLLVPMDTPGITIRPLWTIQREPRAPSHTTYAGPRTNEVFFDDARVPASCLLGQEGDGWAVAQRGLNLDRVGALRYLFSVLRDEDIVNHLKSGGDQTAHLRNDPAIRDKIAELWIEGQVCRLMTMRSLSIDESGAQFSYEGAAEKVWGPEHGMRATETISQILGPSAQLMNGSPLSIDKGVFAHNLLGAFQSTVNHGSVQIMRDQVARRGLGMPRSRK